MTALEGSRSVVQCPQCGFKTVERRPAGRGPGLWTCPACASSVRAPQCCVFCSYGSLGCRAPQTPEPG
ncbi:GDCCVxC domain-containing (seleno)protein [Litorivivens sp.]|uniref:GDCCVxC domain-containing (seleno)protein n=1 Tax=Litorivivens sp. TaxID=2020868 RepID=UPI0035674DB1